MEEELLGMPVKGQWKSLYTPLPSYRPEKAAKISRRYVCTKSQEDERERFPM
jgi:hypothetical protein